LGAALHKYPHYTLSFKRLVVPEHTYSVEGVTQVRHPGPCAFRLAIRTFSIAFSVHRYDLSLFDARSHTQPFTDAYVVEWYQSLVMFAVFAIFLMLFIVTVMWLTSFLCKRDWCYGDPANKYKEEKSQVTDRYDASYQPHNFIVDEDEDDDDDDVDVDHAGAKGARGGRDLGVV
jgi:hypothetical protein